MLQLLLERGQSYADLGELLGVGEAEVRARARAALAELGGADPDRHVGLTDYLLGQADPIGRADAVRHLKDDPDDLALATEIAQKALLIAPEAELPRLPGSERQPRPRRSRRTGPSRLPVPDRLRRKGPEAAAGAASRVQEGETGTPRTASSRRQTQLMVGLGSGAVLLVAVVLAVAGAFSSGSDDTATPSTTNTTAADTSGRPQGFPLTQVNVGESGDFQDTFSIPRGYQVLLPRTQALYLTVSKAKSVLDAIRTALDSQQPVRVEGKTAFAGIVNSANAQKNVIPIPLRAARGVRGSGAAALALSGNQPVLDMELNGLEPAPKGSAYIVWFVVA
jgi:hypothetical protein